MFENLEMEDEKVGEFCVRLKACVNKMETLGEEVSNEVVVKKVLKKLLLK